MVIKMNSPGPKNKIKANVLVPRVKETLFCSTLSKDFWSIVVSIGQHFERVLEQLEGVQEAGSGRQGLEAMA